jgi:quercetin dioxygenase-like cupin family protein
MTADHPSPANPHYQVKRIEKIIAGNDVQVRLFTLAPGDVIPWHYHRQCSDYYFVLEGELIVATGKPEGGETRLGVGSAHSITSGTTHLVANRSSANCRFLLVQGVGLPDWVKAEP